MQSLHHRKPLGWSGGTCPWRSCAGCPKSPPILHEPQHNFQENLFHDVLRHRGETIQRVFSKGTMISCVYFIEIQAGLQLWGILFTLNFCVCMCKHVRGKFQPVLATYYYTCTFILQFLVLADRNQFQQNLPLWYFLHYVEADSEIRNLIDVKSTKELFIFWRCFLIYEFQFLFFFFLEA